MCLISRSETDVTPAQQETFTSLFICLAHLFLALGYSAQFYYHFLPGLLHLSALDLTLFYSVAVPALGKLIQLDPGSTNFFFFFFRLIHCNQTVSHLTKTHSYIGAIVILC